MRRMVMASAPSVSITVNACSTMASLLSSLLAAVAEAVLGVTTRTIHDKT
jgi:hypothetical protein